MARYDASNAKVLVFTFKEGLLSAMAHDLKLELTRFTIDLDATSARAEFDASSIKVVTPMKDGAEHPSLLPTALYGEIEKNARNEVLNAKKYTQVPFISTVVNEIEVIGQLTLAGTMRTIRGKRTGNAVEFKLDVRDFGIKPFSAMLGTLKVKPEVMVRVELRAA
ncbi:MAG: YceI family protein [Archangium sp.]